MREQGYHPHIQHKKPQSKCQKKRNHRISKIRVRVEHVFAEMTAMGGKEIRTIGLKRATFMLTIKVTVYNIKRLCSIIKSGPRGILVPKGIEKFKGLPPWNQRIMK